MPYQPDTLSQVHRCSAFGNLHTVLQGVCEPFDLLQLLGKPILINPSDLFAIVECETRLRGYSGDRTVSAVVYLLDFYQEAANRFDTQSQADNLLPIFSQIITATVEHYQRTSVNDSKLIRAIDNLGSTDNSPLICDSFERRFQDWHRMIKTARRMKQSTVMERSNEYGLLPRGVIVADRIGNMLSHVRYHYREFLIRSSE